MKSKTEPIDNEIKLLQERIAFLQKTKEQEPLREATAKKIKGMKDLYYKNAILTWGVFRESSSIEYSMAAVKVGEDDWETTMGDYINWQSLKEEWLEALEENPVFELWEVTELTQVI